MVPCLRTAWPFLKNNFIFNKRNLGIFLKRNYIETYLSLINDRNLNFYKKMTTSNIQIKLDLRANQPKLRLDDLISRAQVW